MKISKLEIGKSYTLKEEYYYIFEREFTPWFGKQLINTKDKFVFMVIDIHRPSGIVITDKPLINYREEEYYLNDSSDVAFFALLEEVKIDTIKDYFEILEE